MTFKGGDFSVFSSEIAHTADRNTHTHTHTYRDPQRHQRPPGHGGPGKLGMEEEEGAGHTSLPGVQLISPPFVPGEKFKHPPKPLPLPSGSTRQLYLKVQIQPLSLFLFALQLLFREDGDNPLCHRHTHTSRIVLISSAGSTATYSDANCF